MIDQATTLRRLVEGAEVDTNAQELRGRATATPRETSRARISYGPARALLRSPDDLTPPPRPRLAQAVAITSGKGGVGKTNVAVNLAVALASQGTRVCLLDGDLGLANADILCNLTPRLTLDDVVHGRRDLRDIVLPAPGGFRLVPGASGLSRMAELSPARQDRLLRSLADIERAFDVLLIDTGAGIGATGLAFVAAAERALVVTTPEPTAVTDAYGVIKSIHTRAPNVDLAVVVNMARDEAEGRDVARRLARVGRTFLARELNHLVTVPDDPRVRDAVRARSPFAHRFPNAPASRAVARAAEALRRSLGVEADAGTPRSGFRARLARIFGRDR